MKKIISSVLAATVIICSFAGCQKQPTDLSASSKPSGSSTGESQTQAEQYDYAKLTWFFNEGGRILEPNAYPLKKIQEDLNIELVHVPLPSGMDYIERLAVLTAGGETPDIIDCYPSIVSQMLKENMIIPVEEYLNDKYLPNLIRITKNWDSILTEMKWSDGHTYTIPSEFNNPLTETPWIRTDWLEKLNLEVPKTMDELLVVLKAFANGDPNGDGVAHYGTMVNEFWGLLPFFEPFGVGTGWYKGEDGLPELGLLSPRVKEALAFCKQMYDDGSMNRDFTTMTAENLGEKIKAGLVGYSFGWNASASEDSMKELYPNAKWDPMTPAKGVYDKGYRNITPSSTIRNYYAISKECKDVEAALRLMNYMSDDTSTDTEMNYEGTYWNALGQKGVNWDIVNGVFENGNNDSGDEALAKKFKDQNDNVDKWVGSVAQRFRSQFDKRWMGANPRNVEEMNFLLKLPTFQDIPTSDPLRPYFVKPIEDSEVSAFTDDIVNYKFAELLCYNAITGKDTIDNLYDKFLKYANDNGYQAVRESMKTYVVEP